MSGEILKLAKECDTTESFDFIGDTILAEFCESFYRAAFNAGLEAAAKVCDDLGKLNCPIETDSRWQWGECSSAIRALEMKP